MSHDSGQISSVLTLNTCLINKFCIIFLVFTQVNIDQANTKYLFNLLNNSKNKLIFVFIIGNTKKTLIKVIKYQQRSYKCINKIIKETNKENHVTPHFL